MVLFNILKFVEQCSLVLQIGSCRVAGFELINREM